jgi:hypothetical protein
MAQTSVDDFLEVGMPGQLITNDRAESYINNSKKLDAVTITAADLSTTVTINGTAFNVNSGAAVKTKTELRDLLITAINAGSEPVTASIKDADELYVESNTSGVTTTVVGTTNCSVAAVLPNEISVPFGTFLTQDTNITGTGAYNIARLPNAAIDITTERLGLGVSIHEQATENALASSGAAEVGYRTQSTMSLLRKGLIWVQVEDAVVPGGEVFVRFVAGAGGTQLGAFRSDADTASAGALPNARYKSGASAGGLAQLDINLP